MKDLLGLEPPAVMNSVKKLFNKYADELTKQEMQYQIYIIQISIFFGLTKIHKAKLITIAMSEQKSVVIVTINPIYLKLSPIIADPKDSVIISIYIALQPLTKYDPAYLKDNFDISRTND